MTIEEAKVKLRKYFEEACDVLRVNHQQITFAYDYIGERFRTEGNTCEIDGNTHYINEDWIKRKALTRSEHKRSRWKQQRSGHRRYTKLW